MTYFNSFRANDQYRTQHVKYSPPPPPPQKTVIIKQQVLPMPAIGMPVIGMPGIVGQNVTINNGPQNPTAAFLGGFLGAVGSNILGVLNKSDGAQTPKQDASVDYLANLKTLFPKNAVVDDGGGKYTIVKDDGTNFSGTYQEIKAEMNKKNEVKPQGPKQEVKPEVKPDTKPDVPEVKHENAMSASDASGLKGKPLTVKDGGYAKSDFRTTVSEMKYKEGADKANDFPQTLTLKTSGGKTLELTFSKMDGNEAIYTSKDQEYRLENGASGPILLQKEGDRGYGEVNYHRKEL